MNPKDKKTVEEKEEQPHNIPEQPEAPDETPTESVPPVDELAHAQTLIEEQKDKYLRLAAEFDNYRKRTIKEKAELILNGSEKTITGILPVIDDMERAVKIMETSTDIPAIKTGMELIYNKFITILEQNGAKTITTQDQVLNTDYHEAIAVIPAPSEKQKGKIIDCIQTGYTLNDKVIRHAKVIVGE